MFNPVERSRIFRAVREEDRLLKAASHMLASVLLGEKLGIGYRELRILRGPFGKPYLDLTGAPSFNVSHSGRLAVCALAEDEVGIDVELCEPLDRLTVQKLLGSSWDPVGRTEQEELNVFYERWTMLESWIKAEGTGFAGEHTLDSFAYRFEDGYFRADARERDVCPWVIEKPPFAAPLSERYALAVCRRPEEQPPEAVGLLDTAELARRFRMLL